MIFESVTFFVGMLGTCILSYLWGWVPPVSSGPVLIPDTDGFGMAQSRPGLIGRPCLSCLGLERPADFFYKESLSEYSGFSDHVDVFTATPLCLCSVSLATGDMQINVWLCANKTLFINQAVGQFSPWAPVCQARAQKAASGLSADVS